MFFALSFGRFWHARVIHRDNDGRHANRAARGAHERVVFPHRKRDPLVPFHRAKCFRTGIITKLDVERGRNIRSPFGRTHLVACEC